MMGRWVRGWGQDTDGAGLRAGARHARYGQDRRHRGCGARAAGGPPNRAAHLVHQQVPPPTPSLRAAAKQLEADTMQQPLTNNSLAHT